MSGDGRVDGESLKPILSKRALIQLLPFLRQKCARTGLCSMKQAEIATACDCGVHTVNRCLAELVAARLISSTRHGHGNVYRVLVPGRLVEKTVKSYRDQLGNDAAHVDRGALSSIGGVAA